MLVALLAAGAVAASPPTLQAPDWLRKPTAQELGNVFPTNALRHNLGGQAMIMCVVNVHGLLEGCVVSSESPHGEGFGAAALLLAPRFSMRPAIGPKGPVPAIINIPIRFDAPGTAPSSYSESRLPPGQSTYATGAFNMIIHPIWSAAPSFAQVGAAYPAKAGGEAGHVVMRCRVDSGGALKTCSPISEAPQGKGFARAAETLVGDFRLSVDSPPKKDAGPIYVDVPLELIDPRSAEFQQRRIGAPTWRVALNPTKVAQVFPAAAAAKGVTTGRGVVRCAVAADGSLRACEELPGDPDGLGFSHSAMLIAQVMAINPWTDEGGPVDGAMIAIPIRFNLAAESAKALPDKPK
jgi:TonB family protein